MASPKRTFRMFVEEELGILPHFLVWAILEWMLILSLYLDGFLTFISNKFADIFELDPPCVLCTRVDHAICGKNPNLYYNESICDSHKKDISSLAYCHVHRKLSDIRTMCESCLLSFATEKESDDTDTDTDTDTDNTNQQDRDHKPEKKIKDVNIINGVIDPNICSCCGESLKPKEPSKEFSRSLSNLRSSSLFHASPRPSSTLFPTSSPRVFSSLAPTSSPRVSSWMLQSSSPRAFSGVFPPSPRVFSSLAPMASPRAFSLQNLYTELKFVSDNEPDMPEDEYGQNTNAKRNKDAKPGTMDFEEMNEDAGKTPSYIKGNKFFGIPLTETVSRSPRWANKPPKKSTLEKPDLFSESIEEHSSSSSSSSTADGYSIIQQLKKQVNDNRKTLVTLYMELDEERSAATVAANNAMAMITRLQAEKAGVHMEALQYQRMMDEQAEYDEEAIQILKDLLLKKEEDVRVLESQLDDYRVRYGQLKKVDGDEHEYGYGYEYESDDNVEENKDFKTEKSQLLKMLKDFENHVHASSQHEHHKNSGEGENGMLRREVNELREKLAAIEAEGGFLKQTAIALEKGDQGIKLVTEIAQHLRKLQA